MLVQGKLARTRQLRKAKSGSKSFPGSKQEAIQQPITLSYQPRACRGLCSFPGCTPGHSEKQIKHIKHIKNIKNREDLVLVSSRPHCLSDGGQLSIRLATLSLAAHGHGVSLYTLENISFLCCINLQLEIKIRRRKEFRLPHMQKCATYCTSPLFSHIQTVYLQIGVVCKSCYDFGQSQPVCQDHLNSTYVWICDTYVSCLGHGCPKLELLRSFSASVHGILP